MWSMIPFIMDLMKRYLDCFNKDKGLNEKRKKRWIRASFRVRGSSREISKRRLRVWAISDEWACVRQTQRS